jgi:hypothetical protein
LNDTFFVMFTLVTKHLGEFFKNICPLHWYRSMLLGISKEATSPCWNTKIWSLWAIVLYWRNWYGTLVKLVCDDALNHLISRSSVVDNNILLFSRMTHVTLTFLSHLYAICYCRFCDEWKNLKDKNKWNIYRITA